MPSINMSPAARYGRTNYDHLFVGKVLTDARIRFYQKKGLYARNTTTISRKVASARTVKKKETSKELAKRLLEL